MSPQRIPINLVWLKRDLRTSDHLPLHWAELSGIPYLIIFLIEPSLSQLPDASARHLRFQLDAIASMQLTLSKYQQQVYVFAGEAMAVFEYLLSGKY